MIVKKASPCCSVKRNPNSNTKINKEENITTTRKDIENMIYLPGGKFLMGTDSKEGFSQDGESPVHEVQVDSFYIDPIAVTNEQFSTFIEETGYVTEAEKFGWSFVFYLYLSDDVNKKEVKMVQGAPWWVAVNYANWKHPEGSNSTIEERLDHPVVHVSWNDALQYCKWAKKRLPTEAEWEYAARGGLEQNRFPWGNELTPDGKHVCNIWQGNFPTENLNEDGYATTAPAKSFSENNYGLYNMSGNVWEWCRDWYSNKYYNTGENKNPKGPRHGVEKVIRGGSYLCHHSYCNRYRVAARSSNTPDSSAAHMGFRCVVDE